MDITLCVSKMGLNVQHFALTSPLPPHSITVWEGPDPQPTDSELQTAWDAYVASEPLRLLRIERDRLLAESDWWASSDLTMSAKRKSYRQALRDLPASASPSLDESGQLTGVTWPTKPK
jgi:hypothetical protein